MKTVREEFSSKFGFLMAAAGSAVGLGNLLAFPVAAAKNGGGAFLVLYLLFVFLICLPIVVAELAIGQSTQQSPLSAFKHPKKSLAKPFWSFSGFLLTLTPFMIAVFYSVVTVWLLGYLTITLQGRLDQLANPDFFSAFIKSDDLFFYLIGLMFILGIILFQGVQKGIERSTKILMPTLFILIVALALFVLTLENSLIGLKFYLLPDFSKINLEVVNGALSQAFFSLSLGMGILITYGSYLNKKANINKSATMLAGADTFVAFFAGLLTLPAIFAIHPNTNPADLSTSSVGLIFSYFPKIFMEMQPFIGYTGASLFAGIFFSLALIAAITSLISIFEVAVATVRDHSDLNRHVTTFLTLIIIAICTWVLAQSFGRSDFLTNFIEYGGTNKSLFDLIVDIFYETILPFNGFLICIYVTYHWKNLSNNLEKNNLLTTYTNISLRSIVPLLLLTVFLSTVYSKYL